MYVQLTVSTIAQQSLTTGTGRADGGGLGSRQRLEDVLALATVALDVDARLTAACSRHAHDHLNLDRVERERIEDDFENRVHAETAHAHLAVNVAV